MSENSVIDDRLHSIDNIRREFSVRMHSLGSYCDSGVEGKAFLCADGDYEGVEYDTRREAT